MQSLVISLVLQRLDYGSELAGIPIYLIGRPQSVLTAAARLVFSTRGCDHAMPLLKDSKTCTGSGLDSGSKTNWKCLPTAASMAWRQRIPFQRSQSRRQHYLCSSSADKFVVPRRVFPPLTIVPSPSPLLVPGTVCRSLSHRHSRSSLSPGV